MASGGSGTSTRSSRSSGSEEDIQIIMDQKKRKRMISNRESAKRSRMKKRNHMEELTKEIARFKNVNDQIITAMNGTAQLCVKIESENSVLRTQVAELSHMLQSLNDIIELLNAGGFIGSPEEEERYFCIGDPIHDDFFNISWDHDFVHSQQLPLMASSMDVFQ